MRNTGTRNLSVIAICLILATSILHAPPATNANEQNRISAKSTALVPSSCSSNCPAQQPPVMIGWGGLRLDSATTTCSNVCYHNSTYTPSNVFPGQNQTDMERLVIRMQAMGLNTIRVSFAPYCTNPNGDRDDSPYSFSDTQNTIKIANYYHFWIVLRYDGNEDISTATSCWLGYWQPIVQQVGPLYDQIVWEPINEPNATVTILSSAYQQWINMTRSTGDQHFIVVENQCSSTCPYNADMSLGYPTVTDPLGKVLISLHDYMSYRYYTWTAQAAISHAQQDYQAVVKGEQTTGWYALDTEGGADPQVPTCNGPNGTTSGCPPDDILPGSAGYSDVSLTFIQALTQLFDNHNPRINWIWWPAGTWIDTPCAGTYGALQPLSCPGGIGYKGGVGWGNLLNYVPANGTSPRFPLSAKLTFTPAQAHISARIVFDSATTGGLAPYRLSWSFGDGSKASGSSASHAYASAGQYNVTLNVEDLLNRTFIASQMVKVITLPPENPSGGRGLCLPCMFTRAIPVFLLLTIGTAYWFLTVAGLSFTRYSFRSVGRTSSQKRTVRNGKAPTRTIIFETSMEGSENWSEN